MLKDQTSAVAGSANRISICLKEASEYSGGTPGANLQPSDAKWVMMFNLSGRTQVAEGYWSTRGKQLLMKRLLPARGTWSAGVSQHASMLRLTAPYTCKKAHASCFLGSSCLSEGHSQRLGVAAGRGSA